MRLNSRAAVAVVFSAVLQTFIFPVAGALPQWRALLAWVGLVPWLWLLLKLPLHHWRDVRTVTGWSYLCGALWYLGHCYWVFQTMHQYGGLSSGMSAVVLVLFCLYLGLYHALFGFLLGALRLRVSGGSGWMVLIVPVVWVAVELARARVTSFPWDLLGYSQIDNAALTPMAPWVGTYGISFVLALVNAGFAVLLVTRSRSTKLAGLAAGLMAMALGTAGYLIQPPVPPATHAAVLVQPDLRAGVSERKSDAEIISLEQRMVALTEAPKAAISAGQSSNTGRPSLVLWPEAPVNYELNDPAFRETLHALATQQNATVIADAEAVERDDRAKRGYRLYNAAALFTPARGFAGQYSKIHLVPFGEFMPYASLFSFASGLTQQVGLFDRGKDRFPLQTGEHRYGIFICYESIFADEIRQFVLGGADVLVNLSDDGWYGDSSAPFQHINMARMRAIENRRWMLRDTNNGITASIDPYGTVREWAPRHVRTAIVAHFAYANAVTFYTRHGDLFAYACAAVTSFLLVWTLIRKPGHRR